MNLRRLGPKYSQPKWLITRYLGDSAKILKIRLHYEMLHNIVLHNVSEGVPNIPNNNKQQKQRQTEGSKDKRTNTTSQTKPYEQKQCKLMYSNHIF